MGFSPWWSKSRQLLPFIVMCGERWRYRFIDHKITHTIPHGSQAQQINVFHYIHLILRLEIVKNKSRQNFVMLLLESQLSVYSKS